VLSDTKKGESKNKDESEEEKKGGRVREKRG
jgi:hypothetical protein